MAVSIDELVNQGEVLARNQTIVMKRYAVNRLRRELMADYRAIAEIYDRFNKMDRSMDLYPGAEWLLDNFYKIEQQVKMTAYELDNLNTTRLGILETGEWSQMPRIFALAQHFIGLSEGYFDTEKLGAFLWAYQSKQILNMTELWLLALMIKLALVRRLQTLAGKIGENQSIWNQAGSFKGQSSQWLPRLREEWKDGGSHVHVWVERLAKKLRNEETEAQNVFLYFEQLLSEHNLTMESALELAHKEQAHLQHMMGNCINSLIQIAADDWNRVTESLSAVERTLQQDPCGIYEKMDFESRDYYRRQVERLALKSGIDEIRVAEAALELAQQTEQRGTLKSRHVGYYLIGRGRERLVDRLGIGKRHRRHHDYSHIGYLLSIAFFTLMADAVFFSYAYLASASIGVSLLIALLLLVPVSEFVIRILHWVFIRRTPPHFLPKMNYDGGIPQTAASLVVVPVVLKNKEHADRAVANLETHYLANREQHLYFALLGEFADALQKQAPDDPQVVAYAAEKIAGLNEKYGQSGGPFYYLQRERRYNPQEGVWMDWERKRGALVELNRLLTGERETSHLHVSEGFEALSGAIKYVITLDADTLLPMDTARRLIATITHPLNQAVVDEQKHRVTEGYGLIQPGICTYVTAEERTLYADICAGQMGIDSYTSTNSDLYQDRFSEGIFMGKGIYDVEVCRKLLDPLIPDNKVLSHDLLEGCFVRSALATDIAVLEDFPNKYLSYMQRMHRWVRGDWQLFEWLGPLVKTASIGKIRNPLTLLSKWKIFDNLRRSLQPVFLLLLFFGAFGFFPGNALVWLGAAVVLLLTPVFVRLARMADLISRLLPSRRSKVRRDLDVSKQLLQAFLQLAFLPYEAYLVLDAIVRTIYRLTLSKKYLLRWTTAAEAEEKTRNDFAAVIKSMLPGYFIIALIVVLTALFRRELLPLLAPFAVLWIFSSYIAYFVSRRPSAAAPLPREDHLLLRRIARKSWAYFEDFSGKSKHDLPCDNVQEYPPKGTADRTSPTNIGLYLASLLAAADFGYVSAMGAVRKMERSVSTIERLDKWRGHLFNWYDLRALEVLRPKYVSSVDSGNFVALMMVLSQGLKEYPQRALFDEKLLIGFEDTLELVKNEDKVEGIRWAEVYKKLQKTPQNAAEWRDLFDDLARLELGEGSWAKKFRLMAKEYRLEWESLFLLKLQHEEQGVLESVVVQSIESRLERIPGSVSLEELNAFYTRLHMELIKAKNGDSGGKEAAAAKVAAHRVSLIKMEVEENLRCINSLVKRTDKLARQTDFSALYDDRKQLLSIGYDWDNQELTGNSYDLLASEARLASYVAVVQRQLPKRHWYRLGRQLTAIHRSKALLSWSGTMFEYLMPVLVMKHFERTLLDTTCRTVVKAQQNYGRSQDKPWGISESAFYFFDLDLNYQYKAFGIPQLGLKRGLAEDYVISPYSTLLALPFDPERSLSNLKRLIALQAEGEYGLYDALDFTPSRISDKPLQVVRNFMSHHTGMGFLAIYNYLHENAMVNTFHSIPEVIAGETLLQEKVPDHVPVMKEFREFKRALTPESMPDTTWSAHYREPGNPLPNCHVLSSRNNSVMLTDRGGGYFKTDNTMVTRWREKADPGSYGMFLFIKNIRDGSVRSAALDPLPGPADEYAVDFSLGQAKFTRTDGQMKTTMRVWVSPEDDAEIRQLTIANTGSTPLELEITSYQEIALAVQSADVSHPAYSKLFIQTEAVPDKHGLLANRRRKGEDDRELWAFHGIAADHGAADGLEYETSRPAFIGRGRTIAEAAALNTPLQQTEGAVLDPVFSLRKRIRIEPGERSTAVFVTGIAQSRGAALDLLDKYGLQTALDSAQIAEMQSRIAVNFLNVSPRELKIGYELLPPLVFHSPLRRKYREFIERNSGGQDQLWKYGISGDFPIVLAFISDTDHLDKARSLVKAVFYLNAKGMAADLAIVCDEEQGYYQTLIEHLKNLAAYAHRPAGRSAVHVIDGGGLLEKDRNLLYAAARAVIDLDEQSMHSQLKANREKMKPSAPVHPVNNRKGLEPAGNQSGAVAEATGELLFYNGYGGFAEDGKVYRIVLNGDQQTPAPWVNVLANPQFGCTVAENGGGYVWAENSRENKLTPWSNDPVSNMPGEAIVIGDPQRGSAWSATPDPLRTNAVYTIEHGFGYSTFSHGHAGIDHQLTQFVPLEDPLKVQLLRLSNQTGEKRKLIITYSLRPVLGVSEETSASTIVTRMHPEDELLTVRNPFSFAYPERTAFAAASLPLRSWSGHYADWLERRNDPAAWSQPLSKDTGGGLDPWAALQMEIELAPQEEIRIVFLFGQVKEAEAAARLAARYRQPDQAEQALRRVRDYWSGLLGTIQVKTPDASMDMMLNGWLVYQSLVCRIWGRSAFYQSGGAYGFRDQLQDAVNIAEIFPQQARAQIVLHCAHQFPEGDVLHWWHPGDTEKGIRTKFSDDLLWLPYAAARYVETTGDFSLLDEKAPFVQGEKLGRQEYEKYFEPQQTEHSASVYEHCLAAIDRSLKLGPHGIPLMGSGDWNDGMNEVGKLGKGESVWLGWFLGLILQRYAEICERRGDAARAERYKQSARTIAANLEEQAWDGEWYRRAYFDNGEPLGSKLNAECRIDSLPQSWAVISGLAGEDRAKQAMGEAMKRLYLRDAGMLLLFTPPFDKSEPNPGYIRGYLPGIRENGGQYTHAATWMIEAQAMLGEGGSAWELFHRLNPINHADSPQACEIYKVEPYVIAADVYSFSPHEGRGGWTWYTGSAGWMYKVGIGNLLGFKKRAGRLLLEPCIPKQWTRYEIEYRHGERTVYQITVLNPHQQEKGALALQLDGQKVEEIVLQDDGKRHMVEATLLELVAAEEAKN